jgi:adenosyl cobinamide kinase/adenosyl cobinamide phosphate guanylyltransferase
MIFITGGARSGKSDAAVSMLGERADAVYIATGKPSDDEMVARIEAHQLRRPDGWRLIEEPTDLEGVLTNVDPGSPIIIDCLTLWLANVLERKADYEILSHSYGASGLAADRHSATIVVTNEVGSGIVPMDPIGRRFRDLQGRVNQIWAAASSQAFLVVAGRLVTLKAPESIDV